eukprot:scaffold21832_cov62-Phaeocystis_antarctica.AAC.8
MRLLSTTFRCRSAGAPCPSRTAVLGPGPRLHIIICRFLAAAHSRLLPGLLLRLFRARPLSGLLGLLLLFSLMPLLAAPRAAPAASCPAASCPAARPTRMRMRPEERRRGNLAAVPDPVVQLPG